MCICRLLQKQEDDDDDFVDPPPRNVVAGANKPAKEVGFSFALPNNCISNPYMLVDRIL